MVNNLINRCMMGWVNLLDIQQTPSKRKRHLMPTYLQYGIISLRRLVYPQQIKLFRLFYSCTIPQYASLSEKGRKL